MNWKRVGLFAVVYFLVVGATGIPFGYLLGKNDALLESIPNWFLLLQLMSSFVVSVTVFIYFAKGQSSKPYLNALAVALLGSIVSIALEVFLVSELWLGSIIINSALMLASLFIGVTIGVYLRNNKRALSGA